MQKFILLFFVLISTIVNAQDIIYTISAKLNNRNISVDSILFENLTNDSRLLFDELGEQTHHVINLSQQSVNTGVSNQNTEAAIRILKNTKGEITLACNASVQGVAWVSVHNLSGQQLYSSQVNVGSSNNAFTLTIPFSGIYIMNLQTNLGAVAYKVVGDNSNGEISLTSSTSAYTNSPELKVASITQAAPFTFQVGDSLRIMAYKNDNPSQPELLKISYSQNISLLFSSTPMHPDSLHIVLDAALEIWRDSRIHSNGLFYELSVAGSDSERHPELYSHQERHIPEGLYYQGTSGFNIDFSSTPWGRAYSIIDSCNQIISIAEASGYYPEFEPQGKPTEISQVYGEAIALRATIYLELCRYFGDVPHFINANANDTTLTSRDEIYEYQINKLIEVEPLMYRVGEAGILATNITRTYVQGLIGRMCLYAGGYATRRTDVDTDFYKNLAGESLIFTQIGTGHSGGVYNRRTDYLEYYTIAKRYLSACVTNSGTVQLVTTDPRSVGANAEEFGNPFQYIFQQMNDLEISSESIYEIAETAGYYSERPYAFGRPSNGRGSNNYPCKSYSQSRFHPTYYYGDFNPNDLRRDVTVAVSGSDGLGREIMISFVPGTKIYGGLANNKWDENRMATPYTRSQRSSGINNPYMRMADVVLMLAEVYAELGEDEKAKIELVKVHNRAFQNKSDADIDAFILKHGGIKQAISEERKLEFGGEGIRRYDLIRTGTLLDVIVKLKKQLNKMVNGLESNGYYTFENGNVISNYIWVKSVDAKSTYGYRLTTQTPDKNNPVLYPGWRGQYNDWAQVAENNGDTRTKVEEEFTNLAIKGLFNYIDPLGDEAANLEAEGYERTRWGADIVGYILQDERPLEAIDYSREYSEYVFRGLEKDKAPIYLVPIPSRIIILSNGKVNNGYGFWQE